MAAPAPTPEDKIPSALGPLESAPTPAPRVSRLARTARWVATGAVALFTLYATGLALSVDSFEVHLLVFGALVLCIGCVALMENALRQRASILKLKEQATRDALTGVWNRAQILERARSELERAQRGRRPLGLLMIDLDHFKAVNDKWGHQVGDEVLRAAARRMVRVLRAYDAVGRYGGEEFLTVLPGCSRASLADIAERLRRGFVEDLDLGGLTLQVTLSIGVTSTADGEVDLDTLIRRADRALYRAKAEGRNRWAISVD